MMISEGAAIPPVADGGSMREVLVQTTGVTTTWGVVARVSNNRGRDRRACRQGTGARLVRVAHAQTHQRQILAA